MQLWRMSLVGLVAAAFLTAGLHFGQAEQQQERERESGKEGARYTILLKDVKVKNRNAKGEHWDAFEGKPDIRVYLKNDAEPKSRDFTSETRDNTFYAKYNVPTITVLEGQAFDIQVYDVDLAINDEIGKKTVKVTREMLEKGKMEWSFGQVESLTVEFQSSNAAKNEIKRNGR